MLLRTHVVIAIFLILIFLEHISDKFLFIIMVLITSAIPDLDSPRTSYGRHIVFSLLQFFTKHRGIIHSFTSAIIFSIIIAIFFPAASFGFFIGYSVHLFCDSFTPRGVQIFWPLKMKSKGPVHTGGRIEEVLFFTMIFVNIIVFLGFFVLR